MGELPAKQAVCVKAPSKIAAEMFGTMLCDRLRIRCPWMRIFRTDDETGRRMVDGLIAADQRNPKNDRKASSMLERAKFVLVIEYLKGFELADKFPSDVEWSNAVFGLPHSTLSANGSEVLRFLGSILVFDILVNNFDRLPCIWDNKGNPGNVMFTGYNSEPIGIDNMVNCFHSDNREFIDRYLARVGHTVETLANSPLEKHDDFAKVQSLLLEGAPGHGWPGLHIDIGSEGVIEIQKGFLDTMQRVVHGSHGANGLTEAELNEMVDGLFHVCGVHAENASADDPTETESLLGGLEFVNPNFMGRVIDAFRIALEKEEAVCDEAPSDIVSSHAELTPEQRHQQLVALLLRRSARLERLCAKEKGDLGPQERGRGFGV